MHKYIFLLSLVVLAACESVEDQKINLENEQTNPLIVPPSEK